MSEASARFDRLARAYENWSRLGAFGRFQLFLSERDEELASHAWQDYEPAMPTTSDGALAAGVGFLLGLAMAFALIKGSGHAVRHLVRPRTARLSSAAGRKG